MANNYAGPNERIVEVSSAAGGCLVAFRTTEDGHLAIDIYQADGGVNVREVAYREGATAFYTLMEGDVGRAPLYAFGRAWSVGDFMGRILPGDVGKRVYRAPMNDGSGYVLQVENDQQRDARLAREGR